MKMDVYQENHYIKVGDLHLYVRRVLVETEKGTWPEVYNTQAERTAFLKGMQAARAMGEGKYDIEIHEPEEIEHGGKYRPASTAWCGVAGPRRH